jgi:EAL and modified HD-GYP domain-containing signal transduction protein
VLVSYAAANQAELIAEKVETAQQYDMVSSQGVQLFQGYWFARPSLVQTKLLARAGQHHPAHQPGAQAGQHRRHRRSAEERRRPGLQPHAPHQLGRLWADREITSFRQAVMLLGLKSCSAGRPCC